MKIPAQQTLSHQALSSAPGRTAQSSSVTGKEDDHQAGRQAWQREMERAQMSGWLEHALTARPGKPTDMRVGAADAVQAAILPRAMASPLLRQSPAGIAPMQTVAPVCSTLSAAGGTVNTGHADAAPSPLRGATETMRHAACTDGKRPGDGARMSVTAKILAAMPPQAETPAPRISLEWLDDGVRLWLGIGADDGVAPDDLARIVSEARVMLAAEGVRLREVMCNGKPLEFLMQNAAAQRRPEQVRSAQAQGVPFYAYFENGQEQ